MISRDGEEAVDPGEFDRTPEEEYDGIRDRIRQNWQIYAFTTALVLAEIAFVSPTIYNFYRFAVRYEEKQPVATQPSGDLENKLAVIGQNR